MTHFPFRPPRQLQYYFLFWTGRITEKITGKLDALSICHSMQSSRSLSYHEYRAKKYRPISWQLWSFPVKCPCAVVQIYQSTIDGLVPENFITDFLITLSFLLTEMRLCRFCFYKLGCLNGKRLLWSIQVPIVLFEESHTVNYLKTLAWQR